MKIGTTELLVILAIVVLIFGPTQIPKLSKMFGKSVKSLRDGMSDDENAALNDNANNSDTDQVK